MALDLLKSAKAILKSDELTIDNLVFKLHYKATVAILIGSSMIGVAKQYFGDPINCQTASGVNSKVLDDYCWIHSTFHVRTEFQGTVGCLVDPELISDKRSFTGAAAYYDSSRHSSDLSPFLPRGTPDTAFYQWVPFMLVLQAALFYIPRRIWKSCEGGLMETFGKDARHVVILKGDRNTQIEKGGSVIKEEVARKYSTYFQSILHHNNGYFAQFLFCQVLNLLIDVVNIYMTDYFLKGRFMKYGSQVIKYLTYSPLSRAEMPNPICTVFPTVTSCTFHSVGTAAGEQKFNSLCILSLNIINEKVYLLLWFWFFGLTLLTAVHLIFSLLIMIIHPLRSVMILLRTRGFTKDDFITCKSLLDRCYLGDWFVLYQLSKNSNIYFFRYLLKHLEKSLYNTHANSRSPSYPKYSEGGREL